jgi:selenocysteine lyase/cysteine desulfurase
MLAKLMGAPHCENLLFTPSTTTGLNLVIKGVLASGDRVLISPLEHNAVMRPLSRLATERGITFRIMPADAFGRIDLDATRTLLRSEGPFALAIVAHASNANGAIQDLAALSEILREIPLLVDAAQSAGVLPIDLASMGIDFLACSAHKGLLGPTGVGICVLPEHADIPPLIEGGTGSHSDSIEQPEVLPDRYESGTLNLHGMAGLLAALEGIGDRGLLGKHKQELTMRLIDGLKSVPSVRLHSPEDGSALCCAFTIEGNPPDRVASWLQEHSGILCRPGLQCAPLAHQHLGTFPHGTVRFSPGWGTTLAEIDTAIEAVKEFVQHAKR